MCDIQRKPSLRRQPSGRHPLKPCDKSDVALGILVESDRATRRFFLLLQELLFEMQTNARKEFCVNS
jgi:hypothetical protein